ncbi:MAG: PAS domain S-box protein [Nitrospirota bacterium]|nr:PAS domain S-box protein [Nitrospirota bacterium]
MKKAGIYIVENEALIVMELKDRLERFGHEVCGTAASGEEALAAIEQCRPDVVLMDIRLAGALDGIETASLLRERSDAPVVYLTAYSDESVLERAAITGPFGYLVKPVIERELVAAIEVALYKHAMERRLRESEMLYRSLFEGAGDAILLLSTDAGDAGRIVDANAAAARMHGYTVEELRGMSIRDLDTPREAEQAQGRIRRMLDGEWLIMEIDHRRKEGTVFPVEVSAGLLDLGGRKYILAFDRDISERRRIETERELLIRDLHTAVDAVSRSRQEWQDTFDGVQDLIYITDADYRILKSNKAFDEYYKLMPGDRDRKRCYEIVHGMDHPPPSCPHTVAVREGRSASSEMPDPVRGAVLQVMSFPVRGAAGAPSGSITITRDVTEQKKTEERLMQSERLSTVGQMASGIAHEINNPLSAILGCASGLRARIRAGRYDPEFFLRYLGIIEEEVNRCSEITTNTLAVIRKSNYEERLLDIADVLHKTVEIVRIQGRLRDVNVTERYGDGFPPVRGRAGELRQVFLILITNALDAMGERGEIALETRLEPAKILACVSDTGPGIAPEDLTRIFTPFFTTKTDTGGTGLGLSIARKIIDAHRGDITVTSEPGKGTSFTISLPIAENAGGGA